MTGRAPIGPALDTLAAGGAEGRVRLLDLATDDDEQAYWLGVEGLARCSTVGPNLTVIVQCILSEALFAERAATRRAAAWGLTQHPASPIGAQALRDALDDPDPITRTLAARAAPGVDTPRLWRALGPLLEGDAPTRAGAYRAVGVLDLPEAAATLAEAVELEDPLLSRTALTAWARIDPHGATERARTHPEGVWALIDAPAPVPAEMADGVDPRMLDRPASPLDPGRYLPWPRTHRRLLAPVGVPPDERAHLAALEADADPAKVSAAVHFCHQRRGAPCPDRPSVGHLVAMSVDNRYRAPAHADRAPEIAPSARALSAWLTAPQVVVVHPRIA